MHSIGLLGLVTVVAYIIFFQRNTRRKYRGSIPLKKIEYGETAKVIGWFERSGNFYLVFLSLISETHLEYYDLRKDQKIFNKIRESGIGLYKFYLLHDTILDVEKYDW